MGITIHYSGTAPSKAAVDKIMHIALNMGAESGWHCAQVEDPDGEILRMRREREGECGTPEESSGLEEYHGPVSMLIMHPGGGCEPLRLYFGNDHRMDGFVKTQYGPIETHLRICEIFREIQPHFDTFEVYDEGEYWQTGDLRLLDEKRQSLFDAVADLEAKFKAARKEEEWNSMYDVAGDNDEPDGATPN